MAWVRFENGIRMVFKTSWCMHMDSLGGTFFLGTKAGLRIGVSEVKGPEEGLWVYRDEFGTLTNTSALFMRPLQGIELFKRENLAFADAIREGKPSPIDPDGMLLTNVIIQGVIDSLPQAAKRWLSPSRTCTSIKQNPLCCLVRNRRITFNKDAYLFAP